MNLTTKVMGVGIKHLANNGLGEIPGVLWLYRFIWKHLGVKGIRVVDMDGFKLYVDCRDWAVAPTMIFTHAWEPTETVIFRRHVREGMNIVDIGAYIGYYTVLASKLVGHNGKVYAFEPSPKSVGLLRQNIKLNDCENVVVYEGAVADRTGDVMFHLNQFNPSGNSVSSDGHRTTPIRVNITTLDELLGYEKVDFIKMDVEGGESRVINGMTEVIKNNDHLKMIVEAQPEALKRDGSSLEEYVSLLKRHFMLYIIGKTGLTGEAGIEDIRWAVKASGSVNLFCSRD